MYYSANCKEIGKISIYCFRWNYFNLSHAMMLLFGCMECVLFIQWVAILCFYRIRFQLYGKSCNVVVLQSVSFAFKILSVNTILRHKSLLKVLQVTYGTFCIYINWRKNMSSKGFVQYY